MLTKTKLLAVVIMLGVFSHHIARAEGKMPSKPKMVEITDAAQLGTNENGLGLKVGTQVADFNAKSISGESVAFSKLVESGPLMVVFYRGGWCPYCNFQVRQLSQDFPQFKQRNVTPVLVSVDQPDSTALLSKTYEIPFPVLSDSKLEALEAFNVVMELNQKQYERYKGFGLDLEQWSSESHHKIAVPGVFLIDKKGAVQWSHVSEDYKTRPSTEQLLSAIDTYLSAK